MIQQITNHADQAIARLPIQFRDKPKIVAFIRALCTGIQACEDGLFTLMSIGIDDSEGVQLDVIGKIVGQPRGNSGGDAEYRQRLKARIKVNRSNGTPLDILAVFSCLVPPTAVLKLIPDYPAGFILRIESYTLVPSWVSLFRRLLQDSRSGGVGATFEWIQGTEASTFTLADFTGNTTEVGLGLGDVNDPDAGGEFSGARKA